MPLLALADVCLAVAGLAELGLAWAGLERAMREAAWAVLRCSPDVGALAPVDLRPALLARAMEEAVGLVRADSLPAGCAVARLEDGAPTAAFPTREVAPTLLLGAEPLTWGALPDFPALPAEAPGAAEILALLATGLGAPKRVGFWAAGLFPVESLAAPAVGLACLGRFDLVVGAVALGAAAAFTELLATGAGRALAALGPSLAAGGAGLETERPLRVGGALSLLLACTSWAHARASYKPTRTC